MTATGPSTTNRHVDHDLDRVDDRRESADAGAAIGGTLGDVAGLLAGLGMLAIPGLGPVVAAGWLVSTVALGVSGGIIGGIIGALTQSGISEDEANAYAEGVRRGGALVVARVAGDRASARYGDPRIPPAAAAWTRREISGQSATC